MNATCSSGPAHACNCIGPQNGQPLCPCRMRNVTIENGRYVEKRDLGPSNEERCLFDGVDWEKNPVMNLYCPCPKCSPRC